LATPQHPIGSGLGRNTTARDVLAGTDLSGRVAVVTGGHSGIGAESVRAFSAAGATVVVPSRRPDEARASLAGVEGVELDELDLADLGSVRAFAQRFLASARPVDILLNNAGIMAPAETRVGPGWESQLATNHLGHFALTNLLWPALANGGGRVVSVSSGGHKISAMRWHDLQFEDGYDKWRAYGQSKTANALFAVALDRRAEPSGVRAFSLAPGSVKTSLWRHVSPEELVETPDEQGDPTYPWKTPEQGAATPVWAATSSQLDGMGGVYLEHCDIAEIDDSDPAAADAVRRGGVARWAIDPEEAERLWQVSVALTGIDAFAPA
jgi:NAD(P)-dependent dehydrogenase (short-subunit alcohol dehydrogenase family)